MIKKLWAYLKEKNLQDPENKESFIPDETFDSIFEPKKQLVSKMLIHLRNTHKLGWVKK